MLKHLYIENYILIDKLSIDFHSKFSVVTGETGAGKSIFLGALALLLGNRASGKISKDENKKTILEATFSVNKFHLTTFFKKNDLDYSKETIIRREILPNGKTRGFINDTPVNVSVLKTIGEYLLDIHSQHDNLWLNNTDFQLSILDALAETDKLISLYQTILNQYTTSKQQLVTLEKNATEWQKEKDYLQFQFDQLQKINLKSGEQEEITEELKLLNHFEEISVLLKETESEYYENDENILSKIERTKNDLGKISAFYANAVEWHRRMDSISIELNDLIQEIISASTDMSFDPGKQETLKERLDTIYSLQQKHHVNSVEELLDVQKKLQQKIEQIENSDDEILSLKKNIETLNKQLKTQAKLLSEKRKKIIPVIENKVTHLIQQLGMINGNFKINLTYSELDFGNKGCNQIQFLFNANKEGQLEPINQVASGGELSRLMLAIKSLLVEKRNLPTIIFDEIDTGVSGAIASGMGEIMRKMSDNLQLIAITHLPQIAAIGNHHYQVDKTETDKHTFVHVAYLSEKERITEIAKMLSANKITESSIKNAEELLKNDFSSMGKD